MTRPEEILANVLASHKFANQRDQQMPDPISGLDILSLSKRPPKPDRLVSAINRQFINNPAGVEWGSRKSGRRNRRMVSANPFAEIYLRTALIDVADQLHQGQSPLAHAGRIELSMTRNGSRVIRTRNHIDAFEDHSAEVWDLISHDPPFGLTTDISDFYGSVTPARAETALCNVVPLEVAAQVRLVLEKYSIDSGVPGLPIGPESSAWIANCILSKSDHRLQSIPELSVLRWSDDHILADGSIEVVEHGFEQLVTSLKRQGLHLSNEKTRRNWERGQTVHELIEEQRQSQSDLTAMRRAGNWDGMESVLWVELVSGDADPARLKRIFGALATRDRGESHLASAICEVMIKSPETWECSCPRGARYLARFATDAQRTRMLAAAVDLGTEGIVASEQIVHLLRAAVCIPERIAPHERESLAQLLLQYCRTSSCVPVAGWARRAAYELDPERVRRETIQGGEFDGLHPFEQRWAIAYADPQQDEIWLTQQHDGGRWPTTAAWRMRRGSLPDIVRNI